MREDPAQRIRELQRKRRQEYAEQMRREEEEREQRRLTRRKRLRATGLAAGGLALCAAVYLGLRFLGPLAPVPGTAPSPAPSAAATAGPTAAPTVRPTPAPTATPAPTPSPTPQPTPVPTLAPEAEPARHIRNERVYVGERQAQNYVRDEEINLGAEGYAQLPGVTTFRGNNLRNGGAYGVADVREGALEIAWNVPISALDKWTGVGWNGSPAIVQWGDEVRQAMNLYPEKREKQGLKEVVYAALDGRIYFKDLEDGSATRDPIVLGYPIKGSVTVDPRGYPLLYTGQGIDSRHGVTGPIGFHIYSLLDGERLFFQNGRDPQALRGWHAFDSVALVDGQADTVIEAGENGLLYTIKLHTELDLAQGELSISPEVVKRQYACAGRLGTENSVAVYGNRAYFADNSGLFHCVDLNTMQALWVRDVTDDTDATPLIDLEEGRPMIYTACEVDRQGPGGKSYIRKLDGDTGAVIWERAVPCAFNDTINAGALGSPALGRGDLEGCIVFNICQTEGVNAGSWVAALDQQTGETRWETTLKAYSWSSPLTVMTPEGKSYVVLGDSWGQVHLLEGATGKELGAVQLHGNIEGSPAAFDDMIVVGTRGQRMVGIRIK